MDEQQLRHLLSEVSQGRLDVDKAFSQLKNLPYEDLGFAKLDHHRELRQGFPEVIFCQGKTLSQILSIMKGFSFQKNTILATRAGEDIYRGVQTELPQALYYTAARIILVPGEKQVKPGGRVLMVTAGTADLPVAEEAAVTAEVMGNQVRRCYDVGVAGIHRLFDKLNMLGWADVVIVAAGMDGALASVVGGLVEQPVIAVPTSVGYGASFQGLAALLSMLNSCASGVGVVNIDNGYGAAALASAITHGRGKD